MSTLAEIEQAISHLPPEQWVEIRRWMDAHAPDQAQGADMAKFDAWRSASTGIAKGKMTTDWRLGETRGEDWNHWLGGVGLSGRHMCCVAAARPKPVILRNEEPLIFGGRRWRGARRLEVALRLSTRKKLEVLRSSE